MIEQQDEKLILTFPSAELARLAFRCIETALGMWSMLRASTEAPKSAPGSAPPSEPSPPSESSKPRHLVLTPERQDGIFNERTQGMTAHQRMLRAQATLRDGAMPFRQLASAPSPSGQSSPRLRAQQEGGFADGNGTVDRMPEPPPPKSKLRPVAPRRP